MAMNERWVTQFEGAWERAGKRPHIPLHDLYESYSTDQRFRTIMANRLLSYLTRYWMPCSEVLQRVQSPIEQQMFWSLFGVAEGYAPGFRCRIGGRIIGDQTEACCVEVEPQASVLDYRIDFRVSLVRLIEDFRFGAPEKRLARAEVFVECDGHDFHERTREQAERDRSRDRALLRHGYRTLRFTGSEIWKNPIICAQTVLDLLESSLLTVENVPLSKGQVSVAQD